MCDPVFRATRDQKSLDVVSDTTKPTKIERPQSTAVTGCQLDEAVNLQNFRSWIGGFNETSYIRARSPWNRKASRAYQAAQRGLAMSSLLIVGPSGGEADGDNNTREASLVTLDGGDPRRRREAQELAKVDQSTSFGSEHRAGTNDVHRKLFTTASAVDRESATALEVHPGRSPGAAGPLA
ncbi:hypothetical protein HPB50_021016 [Hyalomma asiaticum]|uniref:Uncharacterized protein n=1 Tax=Hyalomma asiaticum TaxID=266040 RepID=A0ACB7SVP8_HYAAI|nr:hypothetical protein HPB50_021016 [Hyalomma asiaticum]